MITDFDSVVPVEDGDDQLELMHERSYIVRAYRRSDGTLVVRGGVQDRKPPGLYIRIDDQPLTVHHMVVEIAVKVPEFVITEARVQFETFPNEVCPNVTTTYQQLIGLNITRGFTHKVRELFGGPRGCTHTSALLQAMAPVAVQSLWSLRMADFRRREDSAEPDEPAPQLTPEEMEAMRESSIRTSLNTCHVWDEHGEHAAAVRRGDRIEPPLMIRRRLAELGTDPYWSRRDLG